MSDEKQDSRGILERYARQNNSRQIDEPVAEDEGEDDFNSFGWLRGIRDRAIMLQLRKKDGNIDAPSYSLLERAEFDPSEGITLHFAGQKVRIRGQNLNKEIRPSIRLFEGITRHRVPWIQEADEVAQLALAIFAVPRATFPMAFNCFLVSCVIVIPFREWPRFSSRISHRWRLHSKEAVASFLFAVCRDFLAALTRKFVVPRPNEQNSREYEDNSRACKRR